ncbi:MAG: endolytic transglycosylase MltG, partial [Pseudomonadota bacterium]
MRSVWSGAFTILIVLGLALVIGLRTLQERFSGPGPTTEETVAEVPVGSSLGAIAERLEEEGIITSAWLFTAAARKQGVASSLKAGTYAIPPGASMEEVLNLITEGKAIQSRITVVEGWSSHQVVEHLKTLDFLEGEVEELPAEGSIAPDTYFVQPGAQRADVLKMMTEAQSRILAELWETRARNLPFETPEEALILASIIEKETGIDGERGLVASVFVNRLKRPMRLQSDPTIIYGLTNGERQLGRGLRRSEIQKPTPYNTYTIDGLPPTPIAQP